MHPALELLSLEIARLTSSNEVQNMGSKLRSTTQEAKESISQERMTWVD